jgi:carboxyl-terminal processing protease
MPRRNFFWLVSIAVATLLCHQQAEALHRSQSGQMYATLTTVLEEIEENYLEEVDTRELFEAALSGLTQRLDDYSAYIPPQHFTELEESLKQKFGGIGIEVGLDENKVLTIISPLVGTPAYNAGLRAGDKILEIDGRSTQGFTLRDAVDLMRGDPGSTVRILILHEGETEPKVYFVERAIIKVATVLGDRHHPDGSWDFRLEADPQIGYIRINNFSEETASELEAALQALQQQGILGLILDLRNNPGGLLDASIQICDLFLDQGVIVTTRGRNQKVERTYEATSGAAYTGIPIAILVNEYSASASEIVAACLQDHGRAIVIGQRTYGKGSVQNVIELEGGRSALKLTVASYWRPSGKNIHRFRNSKPTDTWGVSPDPGYEVKLEGDDLVQSLRNRRQRDIIRTYGPGQSPPEPYIDAQLRKALEALLKKT